MRFILALVASLFICGQSFAEYKESRTVNTLVNSAELTNIAVQGTANIFTQVFPTDHLIAGDDVVVMYKATSSGTINLSLLFEESYQKNTTATTDSTYLTTKVLQTGLNDALWHMATIDSVNGVYGRIRIQGGAGNDGSTVIQIKVIK